MPTPDVLFGVNPVLETLRAVPDTLERLYLVPGVSAGTRIADEARSLGIAIEIADRSMLDRLTGGGHHQGVAARVRPFSYQPFDDLLRAAPPLLVVLDGMTDPQNLGAIVRSAEVLGAGAIVLPKDRSVGVTPAVIRASSGAALHLPTSQVVNLVRAMGEIKHCGYWIVGLDGDGTSRFQDLPLFARVALVVGGEGKGIRPLVRRACDFLVAIAVRGRVSSLNASAAAAIGLYEVATRLHHSSAES